MKNKREHRVPLSTEAVRVLEAVPRVRRNPYIFPGMKKGRPLSNMSLLTTMRAMVFGNGVSRGDYVPHGFRSTLRDWMRERGVDFVAAEMILGHTVGSVVERTYRRTDLL